MSPAVGVICARSRRVPSAWAHQAGAPPRGRAQEGDRGWYEWVMALLRRALVALGIAALIAAVLRVRGSGGTPPQDGGWRELSGPDLQ